MSVNILTLGYVVELDMLTDTFKTIVWPWLVWINGLTAGLQTKWSLVQIPVRAHAWVTGQVPSWGAATGN